MRFAVGCLMLPCCLALQAQQLVKAVGDDWFTNQAQYPQPYTGYVALPAVFETLGAEAIAGKIKVTWQPTVLDTNHAVWLVASFDAPGHWPARDWQSLAMSARGPRWEANVPVVHLDVPLLYFVVARAGAATNLSPMRLCLPRAAGLTEPSRVFWPFIEGFEEGLEGWRLLHEQPGYVPLSTNRLVVNGYAALQITLPQGKTAVGLATTRVRGWQIVQYSATGLRFWLRTRAGQARAQFALVTNAGGTNQIIGRSSVAATLGPEWQKIELPFDSFGQLARLEVDLFTLEFSADGPREILMDDLSYLGRWRLELE